MAKKFDDVIDFTLGDPDYSTPDYIKEAAFDAIRNDMTKYSANAGLLQLRQVISKRVERETGILYNPDDEVMITVGGMEGIFLSLCCLINPGDEVIIPVPYWVNYKQMTEMLNGKPVLVEAHEENDFLITAIDLECAITEKTKAIIINSPNNPTGAVYDYGTLKEISEICKKHDIILIFDECYKSIVYDGQKFNTVLEFENMKDHAIIINSLSKHYSMTGWRLGYLVGPAEIVSNLPKLQENIAACAAVPSQHAAITALSGDETAADRMRSGFEKRRNLIVDSINKIDCLSCKYPKGTFYAWVNISKTGMKSEDFAYALLEAVQVAVVPGITYGNCCDDYVRIAFTMNEEKILEGVRRIKVFVDSL
ncbi:MAG: pyridoxal phosphate-dependent aminotransferase [Butyrivibrio sp.]|nr:pyridoxal phosphate-dependent aminotransferase [Acetatifactor muris]MCM1558913.1 pyridoxal phosphate-dependent aminotransferase [Butyrivibrio sp.]